MKPQDPEDFEDEIERMKQENQIKRMKLRLEFGADFPLESENEDLPPEIESQFLDNVLEFERAFNHSDRIAVYDFIGKPECRKAESVPDSGISTELERVMQILNEHQIVLDTLCEVNDRELYRFITEELFFAETDNVQMEGWISHFTYEDFHPNHEYDLKNSCTEFFESFFDKESDNYTIHLTTEATENKWFEHFRKAFNSFDLNSLEIISIQYDELNAKVVFDINFSGVIEGSNEIEYFSGIGEMNFLKQWDFWYIQETKLPNHHSQ